MTAGRTSAASVTVTTTPKTTRWEGVRPADLASAGVAQTVGISLWHERFLRAVVLVSAAHAEVRRRGSRYSQELGEGFAEIVLRARDAIRHEDPEAAVRCATCWRAPSADPARRPRR